MKKIVVLLFVLLLTICLALVGCDTEVKVSASESTIDEENIYSDEFESETTIQTEEITTCEETTTPESLLVENTDIVLNLNEKTTIGDFEITITDVCYGNSFVIGKYMYSVSDNEQQVRVLYTVKNIGKKDISFTEKWIKLEYADGYEFNSDLMFTTSKSPDILELEYGVNDTYYKELEVLSNECYCMSVFEVPEIVVDNTEEILKVVFSSNYFDLEDSKVYFSIRP